jgi:hypothetical protein
VVYLMILSVYRLHSIKNLVNLLTCKNQNKLCSDVRNFMGCSSGALTDSRRKDT